MNEFFLQIIRMSISAGWLVLAVLILRLILKKAPKWVSVLLWGTVAVRLICPFAMESPVSMVPDSVGSGELVSDWMGDYLGKVTIIHDNFVHSDGAAAVGGEPVYDGESGYYDGKESGRLGGAAAIENTVVSALTMVWLTGAALLGIYTAVSCWRLRRKVDTAVLYRDNIFQSENVSSPFVLGIIRPGIYLPFQLNSQDLKHVVAHEKAHIRRKDHWWKPFGFFLLAIHWFNPLMWLAYVLLCRDIELACDEKVIKSLGSEQRADYTQALVSCSISRRRVAACPLAFGEAGVKERVKSVMNYKKPAYWVVLLSVAICVVAAVCFLTNPKQDSCSLQIVVPAGSGEPFVYADEEISPNGNYIMISSGEGLGDTEVILEAVQVKTEIAYEPAYLTPGMPVKMEAEKGGWFKIGVNIQNSTSEDMVVHIDVKNVDTRMADEEAGGFSSIAGDEEALIEEKSAGSGAGYVIDDAVVEARLDCSWLGKPLYAAEDKLDRLREILVNAGSGDVGDCGYDTKLTLTLADGEQLTMFKGTDSCDTIVFGSYGGYHLGDKENSEFWEIFGLDAETKALLLEEADLGKVMDRILANRDLDQALDYEAGVEDMTEDAVVLLCASESGTYEAFGLVSPEYGTAGILLNYIIDGGDNWNYLYEDWSYNSDMEPAMQEQDQNSVIFTFPQGLQGFREIYYDTYETGTMSARE